MHINFLGNHGNAPAPEGITWRQNCQRNYLIFKNSDTLLQLVFRILLQYRYPSK
jgi:hypothetical protein